MQDIQQALAAYRATYPQQVRDLAETLCASTTRLGKSSFSASSGLPAGKLRALAEAHGLDANELGRAADAYAEIEFAAANAFRKQGGNVNAYRARIVPPPRWQAGPLPGIAFPI